MNDLSKWVGQDSNLEPLSERVYRSATQPVVTVLRRHSRSNSQRSEGAGSPDCDGHGEQDRGSGAASEADDAANKASQATLITLLRHILFNRDAPPVRHGDATGLQPRYELILIILGDWRSRCSMVLDGSLTKSPTPTIVDSFPFEVPGHGSPTPRVLNSKLFALCVKGLLGLQGVADALKLVRDTREMTADDLKCVLETRDVGRWVEAHAAHNTRRAA